ncbi:MAG: IS110 family transposase [Flavobacteriales bacterium CG_4_10_14_0_2_um_filter_32_8]|nr:MAG: IS110 family transposase [Flavobacteriales bacterium CG_4_10_14_0_2_um_filter_32_8]
MKNYKMIVGIDVSKLTLDAQLMFDPKDDRKIHLKVSNNDKGIKEIIKAIKSYKVEAQDCFFCFENTGIYSMPLSYNLSKNNADYWVVNALEINRSKGISRGKNDKNDAKEIAFYAFTHLHKLTLTTIPEREIAEMKMLFTEREKLLKTIRIMETTKEAQGFIPKEITKNVIKLNAKTVLLLKNQLKEIENQMNEIVVKNEKILNQQNLITSIPGVGKQTALYLIITTKCFDSFDNWRQLACYAGVAPFEFSSGSSVRGRTKVNHLADKKMKSLLNMCALSIKKYDKEIAEYYKKKVDEGKNPMLVMNNIRCKILSRVFATVNRGTPYVNLQKFAA